MCIFMIVKTDYINLEEENLTKRKKRLVLFEKLHFLDLKIGFVAILIQLKRLQKMIFFRDNTIKK